MDPDIQMPTDEQVELYFRSKLADAHKLNDYACVGIYINCRRDAGTRLRCSVDFGSSFSSHTADTLTEAITKIGDAYSPEKKAAHLRQESDRLRAEADKLDGKGETE